ncbi:uncharacterized protein [Blastocystis hominis]|uniref:Mitochondrial import receptor subunit TOM22 n=1 Tax=Blastocystis hominis TaxID=12968 RepID=D8LXV8_BLAHO|nr:uncharacterized protein [Blastocystis hominis]CBK20413.2 unnamed protein product [Blastocystis hominis]|eukprot:XP_012894461.1 uncharacterized protein [Blastocystis hominis]
MDAAVIPAPSVVSDIVPKKKTKNVSKFQKAVRRIKNSSFTKFITGFINKTVQYSWTYGHIAGRLLWVFGCYTIIVALPLAMEIDREQTLMEIQYHERERMMRTKV